MGAKNRASSISINSFNCLKTVMETSFSAVNISKMSVKGR